MLIVISILNVYMCTMCSNKEYKSCISEYIWIILIYLFIYLFAKFT